jgi:hypothetical protein
MALTPSLIEALIAVRQRAEAAGHGGKGEIYAQACRELGISLPTLHRYLAQAVVRAPRKQRSDAGDVVLPLQEAQLISAMLMDSLRKNNKRLKSIGEAVALLRANSEILAARVDPGTGEIVPLSDSAIARALRTYQLHPDQLLRPAPAVELQSLHPNHVWQIDASLCVLYYLNARTDAESGLQVMEHKRFYKNKPANLKRIESDRVWSYEATDHYSGAIRLCYVLGAESAHNLAESFIQFTQQWDERPMYGVPQILMMDMGSANTSGAFRNLARRLDVQLLPHAPENARATGQVENARNIIERSFESGLRLRPVHSLDELNATARQWCHWYDGTKVHSRHGRTRYEAWLTIREEHLRLVDGDLARRLLTHEPESRKVSDFLTVQFDGREFDVSSVPRVMVGEKLLVSFNPYQPDAAVIVDRDEEGRELLHSVPLVVRNEGGFREDANVIGERYRRHADTTADTHRKLVERIATDSQTDEEAAAKRKAQTASFGGRIDPARLWDSQPLPTYMPRKGTDLQVGTTARAAIRILNHFEVAREMVSRGVSLTPERNQQIAAWYPDGVPESDLDNLQNRLTVRAGLRVVGGSKE